ncbi:MAG: recombinase RecA [Clostridia bacterium]|nr:recombinase RecA [Clostridia bacterium]
MAAKKAAKSEKTIVMTDVAEEKRKALEHALTELDKQFGKGSVMKLGADSIHRDIPVIPTGCLTLDAALGVGGIPRGRIVEIYGPESSGKTTVALHVVAEAQKAGGIAAFVDAEHALDPQYARKLGVNIEELYVSQPDTGEQALEITEALVRSGALDVVVIDSVAALVPKAEIDGDMGESFVGLQARLMSQALRKLTGVINKTGCVAIFINQLREKVGVLYGNPETTPGGRALKFYSSVRLDVRKGEPLKNGSEIIGNRTKVKVVKNKVAPPFRVAEFDIVYGEGISTEGTLLDLAVEKDIIHKSGAFFSYGELRLAQGRDNARLFLKQNPELTAEIDKKLRAELFDKPEGADEAAPLEPQEEEEDDLELLEEELDEEGLEEEKM